MGESRRLLLRGPGVVLAAGAHDALSAKLAEQAGFDAIWAGGFGISAVQAVPDANILTLTETLEAVRRIVDTVGIPVVADCDNGYGNAINVMRTAAEFERAGAAGICIEDNEFPKRCSFYAGVRRDLVPAEEHARKIEAATAARRDAGFLVIARTEALIAGLGQEEALRRARAYADAGADAVLVHSKAHDFSPRAAPRARRLDPNSGVGSATLTDPHIRILRLVADRAQRELVDYQSLDDIGDTEARRRREHLERAATRSRARVADAEARRRYRRPRRASDDRELSHRVVPRLSRNAGSRGL